MEKCKNCPAYYDQGFADGAQLEKRYDALLTAAEIRELAESGGRFEGYWAITIHVPYGSNPFTADRLWFDLLNTLTEACGVKITSLRFKLKMNVAGYEFGLREE